MPIFNITSPEGQSYKIEGPEGSTMEQAVEKAKAMHAQQAVSPAETPAAPRSSAAGDFVKSIPRGVVEGFLSTGATEAQALEGSAGRDPSQIPSGEESTKIVEKNVTGKMHEPEGFPGRVGASVGSALGTPASYLLPGGPQAKGVLGAAESLLSKAGLAASSGAGGQVGEEVAGTPGRIVGGVVGGGAFAGARAIGQANVHPLGNALNFLAKAAERDGTSLDELHQRLSEARKIRPDATIADVAGTNVRGQVERLGQVPGAPAAKLETRMTERQQQQLGRISNDLQSLAGTDRKAFEAIDQTIEARTAEAAPLYQRALDEGDKEIWSQELSRLTGAKEVQDAMHAAVTGWQRSQIAQGYGAVSPRGLGQGFKTVEGVDVGGFQMPTGRVPVFPNLQFWDYTKGALDDMIAAQIKPDGTLTRKGRDLTIIVEKMRNELDAAVPSYRAARDAWGGRSQFLNNIEEGRSIVSGTVDWQEQAARFNAMSDANKEAYRIGAISAIRAKMGNDPAKLADYTKYLRSPAMRAKLATIMESPEKADQWLASLDYEIKGSELTGLALKGSPTARRVAQQSDAESMIGDLVLSTLSGHPTSWGLIKTVFGKTPKAVSDKIRARSDDILVDILTTPEGAKQAVSQGARQSAGRAASALSTGALAPHQLPPIEVESP
jgi:hypothetical protein